MREPCIKRDIYRVQKRRIFSRNRHEYVEIVKLMEETRGVSPVSKETYIVPKETYNMSNDT